MKRACLLLALGAFLTHPAFAQATDSTTAPAPAPASPPPATPPAAKPGALTKEEGQELNKARADAIKANPDLAAERKDLDDKNKAWSKKVDAAAVTVDPNVAAIIAKRDAGKKPTPAAPPKDKPADKPADKPKPTDKKPKATDKKPAAPTPSTNAPSATAPANGAPE